MGKVLELLSPEARADVVAEVIDEHIDLIVERVAKKLMPQKNQASEWLTVAEAMAESGRGRTKVINWIKQGKFRYRQDGPKGKITIDRTDFFRYLRVEADKGMKKQKRRMA